jgi:hypothetical protein
MAKSPDNLALYRKHEKLAQEALGKHCVAEILAGRVTARCSSSGILLLVSGMTLTRTRFDELVEAAPRISRVAKVEVMHARNALIANAMRGAA